MNTFLAKAIRAFAQGKFLIVTDDARRENEGDLVLSAEYAAQEKIAFMVRHTSGILCVPMTKQRLDELQLPQMVTKNTETHRTAFTVSVDARKGIATGISAKDRSRTIQMLISKKTKPDDLARPGHVFPLQAMDGGVLERAGHTEAAVDLASLAGVYPAGVIGEIVNDDGTVMRMPQLIDFSKKHGIVIITIQELIEHRYKKEKLIEKAAETLLPTDYGNFKMSVYTGKIDKMEHVVLVMGKIDQQRPTLVRVHSECLSGDLFHSKRCDCGKQLDMALKRIAQNSSGVLLYMRHEGRGIGLANKIKTYNLQDKGLDTVEANERLGFPADLRHYGIGAQILADLGVRKMDLLTNNPKKVIGLEGYGLRVCNRIPLEIQPEPLNRGYLIAKKYKMGHLLQKV